MLTTWRGIGDGIVTTFGRSSWRLPALLGSVALLLLPLYILRGLRLVEICVLGGLALIAAAIGFARPFLTFCLGLFMVFSGLGSYLPMSGILVMGLLLLPVARALFDLLDGGTVDLGTFGFRLAVGVLIAAAVMSLTMVTNIDDAREQGSVLAVGLCIYFALSRFADSPGRIIGVIVAVSLGLGVATVVVLRGLAAMGPAQLLALSTGETRFAGINGDPNVQSAYANCCLPPLLYALGRTRSWARIGIGVLLLLLLLTVILSQSRAGILVLGLVLAGMMLREKRSRGYALLGIVVVTIVALLLPPVYWARFESIAQLRGIVVDRSLQLRQHALQVGWQVFREHPWLGVGLGNFHDNAPRHMLGSFLAHNSYLEIAASLGVFGGIAFVAMLATGWGMAHRAAALWSHLGQHADQGLAAAIGVGIIAFCLSVMTLSIPFYAIVWVLLGLANGARCAAQRAAAVRAPA